MNLIGSGVQTYILHYGYGDEAEQIVLVAESGSRLQAYLVRENTATHLQITDINGRTVVIKRTDIRKLEPSPHNEKGYIDISKRRRRNGSN